MINIDNTTPDNKWEFNNEVTQVFDNMLERSIPQYEIMRKACYDLTCQYRQHKTDIVDLGCSRGEAIAELVRKYGATNHFIGIDVSEAMLEACQERFKGYMDSGVINIENMDLRTNYPIAQASITLCILTLQFTPIEYRQKILRNIYQSTIPGGALIIVEKVLGNTADIDDIMVKIYYQLKSQNGYSQEQIERKRLSLEGVLVPVTAKWNEELLKMAGFNQIDCFWRWMNFAGWIAIK